MRKFRTAVDARRAFAHYHHIIAVVVVLLVVALLPSAAAVRQAVIPPLITPQSSTWTRRQLMEDRPPVAPIAPVAPPPTAPVAPVAPVAAPSQAPVTFAPVTLAPTFPPTTAAPSTIPTNEPTFIPTVTPGPTSSPSFGPTTSRPPTNFPTTSPTEFPTSLPSLNPSSAPTISTVPSYNPTSAPSSSLAPSYSPSINLSTKDDRILSNLLLSVVVPKRNAAAAAAGSYLRNRLLLDVNQTEWQDITYQHVHSKLSKALSDEWMNSPSFVFFDLNFDGPYRSVDEELSVTFSQLVTSVCYFEASEQSDTNKPTTNQLNSIVLSAFEGTSMFEYLLLLENANDPVLRTTQKVHIMQAPNPNQNNNNSVTTGQIILYCGVGAGVVGIVVIAYLVRVSRRQPNMITDDLKEKNTSETHSDADKPILFPDILASDEGPPPESAAARSLSDNNDDDNNSLVSSTYSYIEKNSIASSSVADLYANIEKRNETYDDMTTGGDDSVLGSLNMVGMDSSLTRDEISITSLSKVGDPTNTSFSEIWKDGTDDESAAGSSMGGAPMMIVAPPSTQKKCNVCRHSSSLAQDTRDWQAKYGIPNDDDEEDMSAAQQSALTDSMWTNNNNDEDDGPTVLDNDKQATGVPTSIFAPVSVRHNNNKKATKEDKEIGWEDKYGIPKKDDDDDDVVADLSVSQGGVDESEAVDAVDACQSLTCMEDDNEQEDEDVAGDDLNTTLDSEAIEILEEEEEEHQEGSDDDDNEVLEPKTLDDSMQEQGVMQLEEIPDEDDEESEEEGVVEPEPFQEDAAVEGAPSVVEKEDHSNYIAPIIINNEEELEHNVSIDSDLYEGDDEDDGKNIIVVSPPNTPPEAEEKKDEMSI